MNLFGYIKENKDFTFFEKGMTEIDILLFTQLPYVLLDNIDFQNKSYSIEKIYSLIDRSNAKNYILSQHNALKIYDEIYNSNRYKNIIISNYKYSTDWDMQFSAMKIELPTKEVIVSFEGTDSTIAGWKEDAILSYKYPTMSQNLAGLYLNNIIKKTKENIYVCGHSKGGNLALTGSMRTNFFRKRKIICIYSFDGPGLKESEFNSISYKLVKKRLHNIIPDTSLIGVLFKQENLDVIKSSEKGLMQHNVISWEIEDSQLVRTIQNPLSKNLDKVVSNWLDEYNYEERELIVENFFRILEEARIKNVNDINIKNLGNIIRATKSLDKKTRQVVFNCIRVLIGDISGAIISDEISKIKSWFNNSKV